MARILVVDDEELSRLVLRDVLEEARHTVEEAADGRECISSQRRKPFDLIITDIIMPEQEGLETIIALRREYPDLKIIAISSGGRTLSSNYLNVAKLLGASEVIAKPVPPGELMAAVDACLGARAA